MKLLHSNKSRLIVLTVTAGLFVTFLALASGGSVSASLETHENIYINGDDNFTSANGVINPGAAGTESDPYIIENYIIDASEVHGIQILDTTAHFIVRNCVVENGGSGNFGIYLDNVVNGRLENNRVENSRGLALSSTDNKILKFNEIINSSNNGFVLLNSDNNFLISLLSELSFAKLSNPCFWSLPTEIQYTQNLFLSLNR